MFTKADAKLAEHAARHHSVFTLEDARDAGLTHAQIDGRVAGLWVAVHVGIFHMSGVDLTWEGQLLAACRGASPPVAVSRRAAGAVYGLPGGKNDFVEITCRRWRRARRSGLVVHESTRLDDIDIVEVNGIPVVTAERCVLELAGMRPFPNYIESVIQAARRKRLITYDSMLQTFGRLARRGLPGVKATRIALERWDPRSRPTHSDMESMLIQVLREHGLPEPVTQFPVLDKFGNLVATTDAALPQWKITIEYQSKQEHSDEFQLAQDDRRRNDILAAGYYPVAARYEDLRRGGDRLVEQILDIARREAS